MIPRDLEENKTEVSYRVNIVLYRIALNHSRITSSKTAVWVIQLIGTHEEEVLPGFPQIFKMESFATILVNCNKKLSISDICGGLRYNSEKHIFDTNLNYR